MPEQGNATEENHEELPDATESSEVCANPEFDEGDLDVALASGSSVQGCGGGSTDGGSHSGHTTVPPVSPPSGM